MNVDPVAKCDIPAQHKPSPDVARFLALRPRLLIDGQWGDSNSGMNIPVFDPSNGQELTRIADASNDDIDRAVSAARRAFENGPWSRTSPSDREALLWRLADLIDLHLDELAEIESLDNGKTKAMASFIDVPAARTYFRYMAGWATKITGETLENSIAKSIASSEAKFHTYSLREPVGVVAQIVPWNFPLIMAAFKLAPALAAGCTCVLKPAEETSLSALRLGDLILEAGFPAGVVNIITGRGETAGAALVAHPDVDKIAFTGSTEIGKRINISATNTLKRVSLELGGKSPMIVLPDADPASTVGGTAQAIFFNAGQICTAGSRLYVHHSIFDKIVDGVSETAAAIRLGPGLDPTTEMGPLVSRKQQENVLGYVESGRQQGASITTGGEAPSHPGYFMKPTVMVDVNADMRIVREEIFGPVLVAQRFDDLDEVVRIANDTPYGLAASIWTNNLSAAHRLVPRIKAGTVWINCHNLTDANMPFGGCKQSGLGREHGRAGIEMYTELKSVCMQV